MRRLTRRQFLELTAGAAGGATLASIAAACSSGSPAATAPPQPSPAAASTPAGQAATAVPASGAAKSISMLIDTSGAGQAWQGGIKLFNQVNSGKMSVSYDTVPYEGLLQKLNLLFFAGSSQYDVVPINLEWTGAVQQYLAPLDSFIAADKLNLEQLFGKDATYNSGGHVLGLPGRNASPVFAYRKDLLEQAGLSVPTTIEEWADAAKKLTVKGADGKVTTYGAAFFCDSPHFSLATLAYVVMPYGIRFLTDDLKNADESLRSDANIHLLTVMQDMAKSGVMPNPVGFSFTDTITAWQQGIMATSNLFGAWCQQLEDKSKSKVVGKVDYTLSPGQPAHQGPLSPIGPHKPVYYGGAWYIAINGKTQKKDDAWQLVKFLTASEQGQTEMALHYHNQPTLLSVLQNPQYQSQDPSVQVSLKVFKDVGMIAAAPIAQNADFELAVHKEMQNLFAGKDAKATANDMFDAIAKVVRS